MPSKQKLLSILVATLLSIAAFEVAIYLDGIVSGLLHQVVEYVFTAAIFVDNKTTLTISLLSAALAHTITVLVMICGMTWLLKVDKIYFIVSYSAATALYLAYKASLYGELDGIIILFIIIRFIFHTIWVPMCLTYFKSHEKVAKKLFDNNN